MFLTEAPVTPEVAKSFETERASEGYVMNLSRLWAWRQDVDDAFAAARRMLLKGSQLSEREVFVTVCAMASTLGDSYCSMAFGIRLTKVSEASAAAAVLSGQESANLTDRERALASWARKVVETPNSTTERDVEALRRAGLSDREIFEATLLIAFRMAFSTVNDALGAAPDHELAARLPAELKPVIAYGRPAAEA